MAKADVTLKLSLVEVGLISDALATYADVLRKFVVPDGDKEALLVAPRIRNETRATRIAVAKLGDEITSRAK